MHTVERLEAALASIRAMGYQVRMEWLGGSGGGGCVLRGQRVFFLDLALPPDEQLDQANDTLARERDAASVLASAALRPAA